MQPDQSHCFLPSGNYLLLLFPCVPFPVKKHLLQKKDNIKTHQTCIINHDITHYSKGNVCYSSANFHKTRDTDTNIDFLPSNRSQCFSSEFDCVYLSVSMQVEQRVEPAKKAAQVLHKKLQCCMQSQPGLEAEKRMVLSCLHSQECLKAFGWLPKES